MIKTKKILAILLVVALTVTQLPAMAFATNAVDGGEIIAFDTLSEETVNQTVALGTSLEDLYLPNSLNATVRVVTEDTEEPESKADYEPALDSAEPHQEQPSNPVGDADSQGDGEGEQPEPEPDKLEEASAEPETDVDQTKPELDNPEQVLAEPETMEINISIPVKWVVSPDYDGEEAGVYTFTAHIEGFIISATSPSITVTVSEVTGTVANSEELPEGSRSRNTAESTFPETVGGTVEGEGSEIIAFDTLPEETANQTVTLGTSLEFLNLSNTLNATVRVVDVAAEAPKQEEEGEGEQPEPETDKLEQATESEMMEINIAIPVKWVASPDYDGEEAGAYTFTAHIEGFVISAIPPSITVTVGKITGAVTSFDELPDSIRWQNTSTPEFPEAMSGIVDNQVVQIPLTWHADHDYDAENPQRGLYVFDAVPGQGYSLAGGVEAPRITLYISKAVSRFTIMRIGGGGTDVSPLEITTTDQLVEIAVLVNAGNLESFLFNDVNATVSLKLMNNLDLSAYGQGYSGGKGWMPIGTRANSFKGHFDGGGNAIAGLYINDADLSNVGLFGYINGGMVEKLGLEGVAITGKDYVGGIAGYIGGSDGMVQNCFVKGAISSDGLAGGVAGSVYGVVQNCYSAGAVSGSNNSCIGGIAGGVSTTVQNCYSTSVVNGGLYVGGVVGLVFEGNVQNCAALNPSITSGSSWVRRAIGFVYGEPGTFTLSGNVAFSGMTVGGSSVTSSDDSDMNGADITAAAIKTDGTIGELFTNAGGWTVETGKLPGFGAAIEIPEYITSGSDPNFSGEGTTEEPFLISTVAQLAKLAELVNDPDTNTQYGRENVFYELTDNLDLSIYNATNVSFNYGKGWMPIGTKNNPFKGHFGGGSRTITGLYINAADLRGAGLFGSIEDGRVEKLSIKGVDITACVEIGGIAGQIKNTIIQNCGVEGLLHGTAAGGANVGGLVGYVNTDGKIENCYSSGSFGGASLSSNIGGIAGIIAHSTAIVQKCYSIAEVTGNSGIGGIAGTYNFGQLNPIIKDCVALNPSVSGKNNIGRVVGSTDTSFLVNNFAFCGMVGGGEDKTTDGRDGADITAAAIKTDGTIGENFTNAGGWTIETGKLPGFGAALEMPEYITGVSDPNFLGEGTVEKPYLISTAAQLANLAVLVNDTETNATYAARNYKLIADIDLSGYAVSNSSFNSGKGWVPIGNNTTAFKGAFDGNSKTITGLFINDPGRDYVGLFGFVCENTGIIDSLTIKDVSINAGGSTGGIVGRAENGASISRCSVSGTVKGSGNIGGVVGFLSQAIMQGCKAAVAVSGSTCGGLVGAVESNSMVEKCYAAGSTNSDSADEAGGLAGRVSNSTVQNCYATGVVSGNWAVGGMVGMVSGFSSTVQSCYSTVSINAVTPDGATRTASVGGIVGEFSTGTVKNCAALNPSINVVVKGWYYANRIAGYAFGSGALSGNIGFRGMTVNDKTVYGGSSTDDNGASKSVDEINVAEFWTTATGFTADWDTTVWTIEPGKLPILKSMEGQDASMPEHLRPSVENFFEGAGSDASNPYLINTAADLAKLAELVNAGNVTYNVKNIYYKLTGNLDLSLYGVNWNDGKGWKPIGNFSKQFMGNFDGDGNTISGLYINNNNNNNTPGGDGDDIGLFGSVGKDAVVKNLGVEGMNISGYRNVGGVAGSVHGDSGYAPGMVQNCYSSGNISGRSFVGGVVGGNYFGTVQNCYSSGNISGYGNVGGVVGINSTSGMVQNCYSSGIISGEDCVGGVVGNNSLGGTVQNCTALNPSVSCTYRKIGRVAWQDYGQLKGNYAFSGMTDPETVKFDETRGVDDKNGADLSAGQIYDASFWTNNENWIGRSGWSSSIWTFENNKLPILTGFPTGTQSGDGGLYLIERDIANATVDVSSYYTYTGSFIEPAFTVTFGSTTLVKDKDYTITITSSDGEGTSEGTSEGTKAGTVELLLTGIGNFKGEKADVTYTIQSKAMTANMLTVPNGPFTYTGSMHTPDVTVIDGVTTLVKDADYTVSYSSNIFAGVATVTIKGKGNYKGDVYKYFVINKATPAALTWPNASVITYGAVLSASSLVDGSTTGIWTWTDGTIVPPAGIADYEVTFTPADTTNYDWTGLTLRQDVSLTVNKASGLIVSTQPSMNARKSVINRSYEFDMDNIALNKVNTGTKVYSASEGIDTSSILSNVEVNGGKLTYTIADTAAEGNTATVNITISTANYENVTATLTITVTEKDIQTIGFEDSNVTKTYGNAKFTKTATLQGIGGTGQITYASDNTAVATVNAATGEVTIVGAGSVNITATKAADEDWYTATAVYGLAVNKKTITIKAHDKTAKLGQSQPEYTYELTGLISGESLRTEPTVTCPTVNMSAAGTYLIIPNGAAASANYAVQYQNGTLTVNPASTASDVMGVISPVGSTISGTSITGAAANSISSRLIDVTLSEDATWALYSDLACTNEIADKTMMLSVGANTAYIMVTAEDGITTKIYTITITRSASTGGSGSGRDRVVQPTISAADGTVEVNYTAFGGTVTLALPTDKVTEIINKSKGDEVAIDLSGVRGVTSVELPKVALEAFESAGLDVTTKLPTGILTLNQKAAASVAKQVSGSNLKLELEQVATSDLNKAQKEAVKSGDVVVNINIYTGTQKITTFDGALTIQMPYNGPQPAAIWYLNDKGELEKLTCNFKDGVVSFDLNHLSFYVIGQDKEVPIWKNSFTDVKEADWFYNAIEYAYENGLMVGTSDSTFSPHANTTRGMIVTILHRMEGLPAVSTVNPFDDVVAGKWYTDAVVWAAEQGIVSGYGNHKFGSEDAITREQMAAILYGYAQYKGYDVSVETNLSGSDTNTVSGWALEAMNWANATNLIQGDGTKLMPTANAMRCQVAAILQRFIETVAK